MAIQVSADINIRTDGQIIEAGEYHIDPSSVGHIIGILQTLYSRPVMAVIREYLTNAIDAHVQYGVARKIVVHFPTELEEYYSVRDFAGGLSVEDTKRLLYGIGASGELKRKSNDQIGGFGVGAKCAYSVTNSFTYTVWHGGVKRVWSCEKDVHDKPVYKLVFETKSDEPDGVEVLVPMSGSRFGRTEIQNAISDTIPFIGRNDLLEFTPSQYVVPNPPKAMTTITRKMKFHGLPSCDVTFEFHDSSSGRNGASVLFAGRHQLPGVITSAAYYDIDSTLVQKSIESRCGSNPTLRDRTRRKLLKLASQLVIKVPVGVLQLSPSRETLQYSPHTNTVLDAMLEEFCSADFQTSLFAAVKAELKHVKIIDKCARLSMFDMAGSSADWIRDEALIIPYSAKLRAAIFEVCNFNQTSDLIIRNTAVVHDGHFNHPPGAQIQPGVVVIPQDANRYYMPQRTVAILMDFGNDVLSSDAKLRPKLRRLVTYLKSVPDVFKVNGYVASNIRVVVVGAADASAVPWLADGSVEIVEVPEELPEENSTLFASYHRYMSRPAASRTRYTKAIGTKAFTLNADGSHSTMSTWWTPVKWKNVTGETGAFVATRGFIATFDTGTTSMRVGPSNLRKWVKEIGAHGGSAILPAVYPDAASDGVVYGVRDADDAPKKMLDAGFVHLWQYVQDRFKADVDSGTVDVELLARTMVECDIPEELKLVKSMISKPAVASSTAGELFRAYEAFSVKDKKVRVATTAWAHAISGFRKFGLPCVGLPYHSDDGMCIKTAVHKGAPMFDISSKNGPFATWLKTQPKDVMDSWLRSAAVMGDETCCNPLELMVKKGYDEIPMLAELLPIRDFCHAGSNSRFTSKLVKDKNGGYRYSEGLSAEESRKYLDSEVTATIRQLIDSDDLFQKYIEGAIARIRGISIKCTQQ